LRVRYFYPITDLKSWQALVGVDENTARLLDYDDSKARVYSDVQSMANFFEGIGVLVQRKLIDVDLVADLLADRVIWWWEFFGPISKEVRIHAPSKIGGIQLHDHAEYLYQALKQRHQTTRDNA
jgi:hypothetical protein